LGIKEDEGVGESREQCPADLEFLGDINQARERLGRCLDSG
jgi:hypothetical protein